MEDHINGRPQTYHGHRSSKFVDYKYNVSVGQQDVNWNFVSYDVLVQIYSYLQDPVDKCRASSTCKRWRSAYFEPKLWQDCTLFGKHTLKQFNTSTTAPIYWKSSMEFVQSLGNSIRGITISPIDGIAFHILSACEPLAESGSGHRKVFASNVKTMRCRGKMYELAIKSLPDLLRVIANCTSRLTVFRLKMPVMMYVCRQCKVFPTDVMQR